MLEQAKPIIKIFSSMLNSNSIYFNKILRRYPNIFLVSKIMIFSICLTTGKCKWEAEMFLCEKGFRKEQSIRAGPKRNGDALDMIRSSTFPLDSKANKDPKRNGGGSNVKRSSTVPLDPREFQPIPNN